MPSRVASFHGTVALQLSPTSGRTARFGPAIRVCDPTTHAMPSPRPHDSARHPARPLCNPSNQTWPPARPAAPLLTVPPAMLSILASVLDLGRPHFSARAGSPTLVPARLLARSFAAMLWPLACACGPTRTAHSPPRPLSTPARHVSCLLPPLHTTVPLTPSSALSD
ncbi:hypothetical protein FRC08_005163 [Ceratobasidium sp. 394]|nr:hypothetical protein FRC08_005163 [Ceratobasidium sp. 394]